MAFTLACNSDVFAAIGAGLLQPTGAMQPAQPTSVIQLHGTSDILVPTTADLAAPVRRYRTSMPSGVASTGAERPRSTSTDH